MLGKGSYEYTPKLLYKVVTELRTVPSHCTISLLTDTATLTGLQGPKTAIT